MSARWRAFGNDGFMVGSGTDQGVSPHRSCTMNSPPRDDASRMSHPAPGEVFVWWMECVSPSPALTARWRACLDEAELAKADRFHFEVDRSTYLAAHWLLRNALTALAGLPPQSWRFTVRSHGKPDVDADLGLPGLQFNLSHTRGFVACAVSIADRSASTSKRCRATLITASQTGSSAPARSRSCARCRRPGSPRRFFASGP